MLLLRSASVIDINDNSQPPGTDATFVVHRNRVDAHPAIKTVISPKSVLDVHRTPLPDGVPPAQRGELTIIGLKSGEPSKPFPIIIALSCIFAPGRAVDFDKAIWCGFPRHFCDAEQQEWCRCLVSTVQQPMRWLRLLSQHLRPAGFRGRSSGGE